jgi:hypothetical protein
MNTFLCQPGIVQLFAGVALILSAAPRPARSQCVPTEEKPSTADKKAAAKLELRYGWQPKERYQYEVTIEAQLPDRKQTYKGMSTYQVREADQGRFTLVHTGTLQKNEAMKPQARASGPRGIPHHVPQLPHHFAGPHFGMSRQANHEVTLDQQGKILSLAGENSLPLLLGDLALLVIEPLPERRERTWHVDYGLTVVEKKKAPASPFPHRIGRLGTDEAPATQRPGGERMAYRVKGVSGDLVTILKQSHLKTSDESEGAASREQEGSGELVFDLKRGVMAKADIKLVNTFNQDNISVKVPVQVRYRLLNEEDLAKIAEESKTRMAKMAEDRAKADEEAARPLTDAEAREIIAALKDKKSRRKAAETLAKMKVPDEHQDEIAHALDPLLADSDDGVRDMATQALKVWATVDNVPALANVVMTESNVFARARAMETLGQLKDKRGAEAVAALFVTSRGDARKSLEQMGPVAEPYVLPLLDSPDEGVRRDACQLLASIGTSKSRAKLEKLALKPRGSDAQAAREALEKIGSQ